MEAQRGLRRHVGAQSTRSADPPADYWIAGLELGKERRRVPEIDNRLRSARMWPVSPVQVRVEWESRATRTRGRPPAAIPERAAHRPPGVAWAADSGGRKGSASYEPG